MNERYVGVIKTAQGWVGLLASQRGLRRSTLPERTRDDCLARLGVEASGALEDQGQFGDLPGRLVAYFDGEREDFADVNLDLSDATDFFRCAWSACVTIPRGETRTYGWLARQAGRPNAPRAAGQSMARNRLPIVVPCHRVVGSDGSLRGFGSGSARIDLKRLLLEMESGVERLL